MLLCRSAFDTDLELHGTDLPRAPFLDDNGVLVTNVPVSSFLPYSPSGRCRDKG